MLKRFGFRRKKLYLCIAKRREPVHTGFLLFLCLKIRLFYLGNRKIYLRDKKFFGLGTIFFGLGRSAQRRFRKFFGLQIIKDIKVFRAQKLDFNISGNYSGGLSMTSFFNTNLSNLSNFAERLPEGTIRFVLARILRIIRMQ